jgi:polyhydroxyalkanoate synthesis regulator phasin
MGIFSKLFGASTDIEKMLENLYVIACQEQMQMSASEARSTVRDMLNQAKEESVKESTSKLPRNFGDIILEQESTNAETKSMLAKKRREGVRDENIRWWWNMYDLERRMMVAFDQIMKQPVYIKFTERDGLSEKAALEKLDKHFPIWGDPEDTTHHTGEDRPLPIELKGRIDIYVEKRMRTDPEGFKKAMENSSSLNALIRKLMTREKI